MLEIEDLSHDDVNKMLSSWEPIKFKKVTMIITGYEKNEKLILMTSDFSDEYIGKKILQ
jgi:hypothetical protein